MEQLTIADLDFVLESLSWTQKNTMKNRLVSQKVTAPLKKSRKQ